MRPKQKPKKGFQTYATYVEEFERALKKDNIPVINFVIKEELKTVFETNFLPSTSKDKYLKEPKRLEKIDKNPDVKITCKESSKKSNKSKTLDKNAYLKEVKEEKAECGPPTTGQKKNSKDSKRLQKLDKKSNSVSEVTAESFLKVNSQPKTSKSGNSKESNADFLNKFVRGDKTEKIIKKNSPPNVSQKKLQEINKNPVPTSLSDKKVILETNSEPSKSGKVKMDSYNNDNIRIISKFSLYEDLSLCDDPDMEELIQNTSEYSYPNYRNNDTAGFDWTSRMWLKSGMQPSGKMHKPMKIKLSKDQKEMLDALKTPVKMSKAESMMRKMGWNGGALGKNGLGIVAPIIPNLAYTRSTIGFGQATAETKKERIVKKPPKPSSKVVVRRERKRLFNVNVLFILLDFIRNDSELEIGFDERLSKTERRAVHMLVQSLFEDDVSLKNYDSNEDLELISIVKKNCRYVMLGTHSVGEGPNRQLYIYKEAPDHIYLVVPKDLIPDEVNDDKPKVIQRPKKEERENKSIDFSIFKKPIGQPSLGELIAKVYKEHDENEAMKSSCEINAELKMEDTGCKTPVKSGEMSAELNSENKESETVISSEEMNSELNSENKERITELSLEEMNTELNSENKERITELSLEEMNTELNSENKERITELSLEEMNTELNSENKERITELSLEEMNTELNSENKERITELSLEEMNTELNSENKNCDKPVNSSEISADLKLKNKENIDEIEIKGKVTKQSVNNECVKECSEENCIKTNTNKKIIKKHTIEEVKAEINFENELEKQSSDKMAAKDEKSEINIENDVNNEIPFPMRKLTDYFLEFYEDDYREMRFLGPFDVEQNDFINGFIENVQWCIKNGENAKNLFVYRKEDVYKAMTSDTFYFDINEDYRSLVIHKLEKKKIM